MLKVLQMAFKENHKIKQKDATTTNQMTLTKKIVTQKMFAKVSKMEMGVFRCFDQFSVLRT